MIQEKHVGAWHPWNYIATRTRASISLWAFNAEHFKAVLMVFLAADFTVGLRDLDGFTGFSASSTSSLPSTPPCFLLSSWPASSCTLPVFGLFLGLDFFGLPLVSKVLAGMTFSSWRNCFGHFTVCAIWKAFNELAVNATSNLSVSTSAGSWERRHAMRKGEQFTTTLAESSFSFSWSRFKKSHAHCLELGDVDGQVAWLRLFEVACPCRQDHTDPPFCWPERRNE